MNLGDNLGKNSKWYVTDVSKKKLVITSLVSFFLETLREHFLFLYNSF